KGLVALWRESLLARSVLQNLTKGYRNHPQLIRFRHSKRPEYFINLYLRYIYEHSITRGFCFDWKKLKSSKGKTNRKMLVTSGQVEYEFKHLLNKLFIRDADRYHSLSRIKMIETNPVFEVVEGQVEHWERLPLFNRVKT